MNGVFYLHEWLICMANLGKYTSPMDPIKYTRSGQTLFTETVSKKIKPNSRMAAQKQFGFVNRYSLEFTQKDGVA